MEYLTLLVIVVFLLIFFKGKQDETDSDETVEFNSIFVEKYNDTFLAFDETKQFICQSTTINDLIPKVISLKGNQHILFMTDDSSLIQDFQNAGIQTSDLTSR